MLTTMSQEPMTWVFAGDSITHGSFHNRDSRNYVEHCTEVLRQQSGRSADVIVNVGVSGWRVPDLADDFHFRIARFAPSVVVLMLGTNDATAGEAGVEAFAAGLDELVLHRILDLGADLVLQVPPPLRGEPSGRTSIPSYCDAVREVATRRKIPCVDHAQDWELHQSEGIDELLNDDIHPNAAGHLRMARTFLAALDVPGDPLDFA